MANTMMIFFWSYQKIFSKGLKQNAIYNGRFYIKSYIFHQMISNEDKFPFYKKVRQHRMRDRVLFGFDLCFNYIHNDNN